jgi:Chitobiase/beta-hexosaminidase C-terminal domain
MLAVNGSVPPNPTIVPLFGGVNYVQSVAVDGRGTVYAGQLMKLDRSDPPSLNFAQTPTGQTSADSPQTISIENTGNANLAFSPPPIGTNPSISTNFTIGSSSTCPNLNGPTATPGTLPQQGSCTEMIKFVPTTTGAITGSLVFTDNAFPSTQTVFLSGNVQPTQPPPPTFSLPSAFYDNDQTLTLSDPATIYYTTDGTSPLSSSKIYSGPITLSSTQTVSADANATGLSPSKTVSEKIYFQVALPQFAPAPGRYIGAQSVSITDPTIGSTIYYTTDGSVPTISSKQYTGPITVPETEELRAMAVRTGYQNSYADLARYTIVVPTPVISPPPGKYSGSVTVTIADAAAATIYYTVNGATPTTSSTVYSGPFTISNSETIKAIAVSAGEVNSAGVEAAYSLVH